MKFGLFFVLLFYLFSFRSLFSAYLPLESSFADVNRDYKYYNELQVLYNNQMIYPQSDGKFNAYSLLNRDEFISLLLEVSCTKCTKPNTSLDILEKYKSIRTFYDVFETNKYLYCIEFSNTNNLINKYGIGHKCNDLTYNSDKIPFCPGDYVTLQDAIKYALINANLFSEDENSKIIDDINNGNITNSLALDFFPKNSDGSPNQYFGYIKKALEYSIDEYDNLGNKKTYNLINLNNGKLYPEKYITREDFLNIAYILFKTNSCKPVYNNNLALKIDIIDNTCNGVDDNCDFADLSKNEYKFDFMGVSSGVCDTGIDDINGYIWRFFNKTNSNEIIKYGKYLNDFTFTENGLREINLYVIDKCLNSGEVLNNLFLSDNMNDLFSVSIKTNNIIGSVPLPISFNSIVGGDSTRYSYVWDLGNNEKINGKEIEYIFNQEGVYNVILNVTDNNGNIGFASVLVKAINDGNCDAQDSDSDGISNCDDLCQLMYGSSINKGCPILTPCNQDCTCSTGKKCSTSNTSLCGIKGVCIDDDESSNDEINNLTNDCLEKLNSKKIYGNVICNTCPCLNFIDFYSTYRACDYIFPAITSTGSTDIFSVGDVFEVK